MVRRRHPAARCRRRLAQRPPGQLRAHRRRRGPGPVTPAARLDSAPVALGLHDRPRRPGAGDQPLGPRVLGRGRRATPPQRRGERDDRARAGVPPAGRGPRGGHAPPARGGPHPAEPAGGAADGPRRDGDAHRRIRVGDGHGGDDSRPAGHRPHRGGLPGGRARGAGPPPRCGRVGVVARAPGGDVAGGGVGGRRGQGPGVRLRGGGRTGSDRCRGRARAAIPVRRPHPMHEPAGDRARRTAARRAGSRLRTNPRPRLPRPTRSTRATV